MVATKKIAMGTVENVWVNFMNKQTKEKGGDYLTQKSCSNPIS